jgi:hypothetical protein
MKLRETPVYAVYFRCYVTHTLSMGAVAMGAKSHDAVVYAASLAHFAHPIALLKGFHIGRCSEVGIHLRTFGNGYG